MRESREIDVEEVERDPPKYFVKKGYAMLNFVDKVERITLKTLALILLLSIVLGTVQLGHVIIAEILEAPYYLVESKVLFRSFSLFLVILIGMELLRLVKHSIASRDIDLRLVLEVAVIALCNKIITIDIQNVIWGIMLGIAALLVAVAAAYFVVMRSKNSR